MTDSLREQVARRLLGTRGAIGAHSLNIFCTEPFENEVAAAQAEEVIRLMEWARRETIDVIRIDFGAEELRYRPLTLPPDDWKP